MKIQALVALFATLAFCAISSCDSRTESPRTDSPAAPISAVKDSSLLSFKINGIEWKADSKLFGAFHPPGYDKAIMIAGDRGSNDENEQTFGINLYNIDGPGTYPIKSGNPDQSVVQFMDFLKPDTPMYGGQMDFDITVVVTKASNSPTIVEATFEGTLTGNPGDILTITEGIFSYHE